MLRSLIPASVATLLALPTLAADADTPVRDGKLFDPGVQQTEPAESAPEQLAYLAGLVSDWTVEMELYQPGPEGVTVTKSGGRARITFMNRGHALMERTRVDAFDGTGDGQGHRMSTLAFWNVDGQGMWTLGEGNSWTESIRLFSGVQGRARPGRRSAALLHCRR